MNVSPSNGQVCLGFLTEESWLPTRCVQDVLSGVFALLIRPELANSADHTLLEMYNNNKVVYEQKARKSVLNTK